MILLNNFLAIRSTKRAVFLTYGRRRSHLVGFGWDALNGEGWGVLTSVTESWRYIGDIYHKKPHGRGIMRYVNQTKYVGNFVQGLRDGLGEVVNKDGTSAPGEKGVYIKNIFAPNGIMVEVTVINKHGVPIQYGKVALNKFDSVRTHVDRIGTVMDWDRRRRFRLVLNNGSAMVDVIGCVIDPKESSSIEYSSWDLDGTPEIIAHSLC